ncbi:MAG: hypothetical protein ABIR70_22865 [Bryobacteraceae bacterium]
MIAVEVKSSTLPNEVKYSDTEVLLKEQIEKKFVSGDDDGKKGLSQLAEFLRRFSAGSALRDPSGKYPAITKSDIWKIIPVIIFSEQALRTPGVCHYLQSRLKDLIRVKKPIVTPLVPIPIGELEEIQGHLDELLLGDALESFLRETDRTTFLAGNIPLLAGKVRKVGPMMRNLEVLLNETRERLFPGSQPWV